MTLLQMMNKILVRLRENEVSGLSSGYPNLIVGLINDAKEDVEDAGPWYSLRTTINKTLTSDVDTVSLTDVTNDRSYLLYVKNMPQAFVTTVDEERRLAVISQGEMDAIRALDPDAQNDIPAWVSFNRSDDGLVAEFWPTPDSAYSVRFVMVVPQDELSDASTEITVPATPVWRLALARALDERGEELGLSADKAQQRADMALFNAMASDFLNDDMTFEAR